MLDDEFKKQRAQTVRDLAEKADPFIKGGFLISQRDMKTTAGSLMSLARQTTCSSLALATTVRNVKHGMAGHGDAICRLVRLG